MPAGGAASSGRNLWVSGLSTTTRATDLKNLFSKYGKVCYSDNLGAKKGSPILSLTHCTL